MFRRSSRHLEAYGNKKSKILHAYVPDSGYEVMCGAWLSADKYTFVGLWSGPKEHKGWRRCQRCSTSARRHGWTFQAAQFLIDQDKHQRDTHVVERKMRCRNCNAFCSNGTPCACCVSFQKGLTSA